MSLVLQMKMQASWSWCSFSTRFEGPTISWIWARTKEFGYSVTLCPLISLRTCVKCLSYSFQSKKLTQIKFGPPCNHKTEKQNTFQKGIWQTTNLFSVHNQHTCKNYQSHGCAPCKRTFSKVFEMGLKTNDMHNRRFFWKTQFFSPICLQVHVDINVCQQVQNQQETNQDFRLEKIMCSLPHCLISAWQCYKILKQFRQTVFKHDVCCKAHQNDGCAGKMSRSSVCLKQTF